MFMRMRNTQNIGRTIHAKRRFEKLDTGATGIVWNTNNFRKLHGVPMKRRKK